MPKFFQTEIAAYSGDKDKLRNVKFKKNDFNNSSAAEAGTILEIIPVHIKNPPVIQFLAYLDTISDTFNADFSAQQPFGRPDPYYMWKSNKRSIRVAFSIPSSSVTVGLDALNNLSWFLGALYPTYKDTQTTTSIAASPLFRVRFANLICSSTNDGQGLLGVIKSVSVTPDSKNGFIGVKPENMGSASANLDGKLLKEAGFENSINEGKKLLIPKLMKISFSLDVVHDHALGWDYDTGNWRGGTTGPRFPYDFGMVRDVTDTPSAGNAVFDDAQATSSPVPTPGNPADREAEKTATQVLGDTSTTPGVEEQ